MLETEYFTAEDDPGFDFATVRDLADRNRDLCDQIGEARLRNLTPATLSRGSVRCRTPARPSVRCKRHRRIGPARDRGDRDALGVDYARKPIQGPCSVSTSRPPAVRPGAATSSTWAGRSWSSPATPSRTTPRAHYCGLPDIYRGEGCAVVEYPPASPGTTSTAKAVPREQGTAEAAAQAYEEYPYMAHNAAFEDSWFEIPPGRLRRGTPRRQDRRHRLAPRSAAAWMPTSARLPANPRPPRSRTGPAAAYPRRRRQRAAPGPRRHRPHAPHRPSRVQPQGTYSRNNPIHLRGACRAQRNPSGRTGTQ